MCGGGGHGPIPVPEQDPCPIELVLQIKDILHSGHKDVWDGDVVEGMVLHLKPEKQDRTIAVLFNNTVIGHLRDQGIYRCIVEKKYEYEATLEDKTRCSVRLHRV